MPKLDEASRGLRLNRIIRDKLGPLLDWSLPQIQDFVGPFDPTVFRAYDDRRFKVIEACQNKLAEYADDQVLVLSREIEDDPDDVLNEWTGFQRDEIYKLNKSLPPWYAGGFGHPEYEADFEYWSQIRYLTAHEALILSLGVEPTHIDEEHIKKISNPKVRKDNLWGPLRFLLRRKEQIERQFPKRLHSDRINPQEFFDWVELVDLKVHPDFTSRYLAGLDEKVVEETTSTTKKPDKREIDNVAQLFTAMAISELGYIPNARRGPIPKEIVEIAAEMGLQISEDTVRKYLKLGASFLPDEWEPNN